MATAVATPTLVTPVLAAPGVFRALVGCAMVASYFSCRYVEWDVACRGYIGSVVQLELFGIVLGG